MNAILKKFDGFKTYLCFGAVAILGALEGLQAAGHIDWEVPAWVLTVLASLGLIALRKGVKKS
jgi:hypothetical protein